jgi:hypothetical protein
MAKKLHSYRSSVSCRPAPRKTFDGHQYLSETGLVQFKSKCIEADWAFFLRGKQIGHVKTRKEESPVAQTLCASATACIKKMRPQKEDASNIVNKE